MSLPKSVELRKNDEELPEEEFEDLKISDEDLLLMPAELPEQLMLEMPRIDEENISLMPITEFGKESLAMRAKC